MILNHSAWNAGSYDTAASVIRCLNLWRFNQAQKLRNVCELKRWEVSLQRSAPVRRRPDYLFEQLQENGSLFREFGLSLTFAVRWIYYKKLPTTIQTWTFDTPQTAFIQIHILRYTVYTTLFHSVIQFWQCHWCVIWQVSRKSWWRQLATGFCVFRDKHRLWHVTDSWSLKERKVNVSTRT